MSHDDIIAIVSIACATITACWGMHKGYGFAPKPAARASRSERKAAEQPAAETPARSVRSAS